MHVDVGNDRAACAHGTKLGRPIATAEQARQMLKIGVTYNPPRSARQPGLPPNRRPGNMGFIVHETDGMYHPAAQGDVDTFTQVSGRKSAGSYQGSGQRLPKLGVVGRIVLGAHPRRKIMAKETNELKADSRAVTDRPAGPGIRLLTICSNGPAVGRAMLKMSTNPWTHSVPNLSGWSASPECRLPISAPDGTRPHIHAALKPGATRNEI